MQQVRSEGRIKFIRKFMLTLDTTIEQRALFQGNFWHDGNIFILTVVVVLQIYISVQIN